MKRAAIYTRVSTGDQSPASQLYDLRRLAQQRELEIVAEYTDTVTGTRARRPGLDAMMAAAHRREFDVVMTWAADRMARSVRHFLETLDTLNHLNIEFVSFRENLDTGGPLGRAVVIIVAAVAELERSLIIERVRAGMRRAKLEGRRIGRRPADVNRAAVVRDRESGMTLAEVAKQHKISRALVSRIVREHRHKGVSQPPLQTAENKRPETAA